LQPVSFKQECSLFHVTLLTNYLFAKAIGFSFHISTQAFPRDKETPW